MDGWVYHSWRFWQAEYLRIVGPKIPEGGWKTSTEPVVWAFLELFRRDQNDSCSDWWPWTKPVYIIMTCRQSNNQWSGGIVAQPVPKNSRCKIPVEKFSPRFFFDQEGILLLQRAILSTRSNTYLCWCNWRIFWRKNALRMSPRALVLARQCPSSRGTWNPEETGLPGLQMSWSHTLFSGLSDAKLIAAAETWLDGQTSDF